MNPRSSQFSKFCQKWTTSKPDLTNFITKRNHNASLILWADNSKSSLKINHKSQQQKKKNQKEMNGKAKEANEWRSHLDAMLEAVEFPARIADLNTGLTDVDRNALSHFLRDLRRLKERNCRTRKIEERKENLRATCIKTPSKLWGFKSEASLIYRL
jgi:hypothetical protein